MITLEIVVSINSNTINIDEDFISEEEDDDDEEEVGSGDLRQDYQNAVDCLIQCESLFNNFQLQLAVKDEQIALLEEKVVSMSLELASFKTREDYRRLKKREDSPIMMVQHPHRRHHGHDPAVRRATWAPGGGGGRDSSGFQVDSNFAKKWVHSLGQFVKRSISLTSGDDEKDGTHSDQLYLKNHQRHHHHQQQQQNHHEDDDSPRKSTQSQDSHLLELDGVIFPVSSLDIIRRGCGGGEGHTVQESPSQQQQQQRRRQQTTGTKYVNKGGMRNEEWPSF